MVKQKSSTEKIEKEYLCPYCSTKQRTVKFKKTITILKDTQEPYENYILCPFCGNGVKQ